VFTCVHEKVDVLIVNAGVDCTEFTRNGDTMFFFHVIYIIIQWGGYDGKVLDVYCVYYKHCEVTLLTNSPGSGMNVLPRGWEGPGMLDWEIQCFLPIGMGMSLGFRRLFYQQYEFGRVKMGYTQKRVILNDFNRTYYDYIYMRRWVPGT